MVKNNARKKAARAHAAATGLSYTAAARRIAGRHDAVISAAGVHSALMRALQDAGWPVEYETVPDDVQYRGYAGPARLTVGRGDQAGSFDADTPDPDDGGRLDLSQPPRIVMAAPLTPNGFEAHRHIGGDRPISEVIDELARMLTEGRAHAIGNCADRARCSVCGDAYPRAHLLGAAGTDELPLCPACAFDGVGAHVIPHL